MTRHMSAVRLRPITARAVRDALRRGTLRAIRSITAGNGYEFLGRAAPGRRFKDINAVLRVYYSKSASYCYPALVIASVSAKQPSRSKVAVPGCFVAPLLAMAI